MNRSREPLPVAADWPAGRDIDASAAPRSAAGETLLGVAALVLVWLAATAWARPLLLPDEGRYVGVAWEMLRSGDWLVPTLNGLPFLHKPPLFYWITAASMALFGANAWAARAAPLLGASLGAVALFVFARRWAGERHARMTVFALLAQPLFYVGGQFANLDMLVAGCITATIVLLAHAALCRERGLPYDAALLGAYALAALGVLAKGLIGVVLPALVVLAWLVALRRRHLLRSLLSLRAAVLFSIVAAPWFVLMQRAFPDFLHYFVIEQHVRRFAGSGFNNVQPVWFYPAVLLLFSLPWLPWLHRLLVRAVPAASMPSPLRLLMWLWIAVVVLFFSLPQSKLIGYVLPAVPPLAFLVADGLLAPGVPSARARRLWWASAAIASAASLAAIAVFAIDPQRSTRELAAALEAGRSAQEPVFVLGRYAYDLPFYARLTEPVGVVEDWQRPDIRQHDDWRKELFDAAQFAGAARAASILIEPAALPAALCRSRVSWVIGPAAASTTYPDLAQADRVATRRGSTLWRVDAARPAIARALGCAVRPRGTA